MKYKPSEIGVGITITTSLVALVFLLILMFGEKVINAVALKIIGG